MTIALIAAEATGGYETLVVYGLAASGLPTVIVNPAQVRQYARALGKRAKTDALDAQVIARFAEAMRPDVRPLPDAAVRHLSGLMDRRRQIIEMIASDKQHEALTFRSEGTAYCVKTKGAGIALWGAKLELHHRLDGTMRVHDKDRILPVTAFQTYPVPDPAEDERTPSTCASTTS